jgi:putative nucleotidyltransferase with HDIG domain
MVMGMMVESAADEIGANPVVARVGAYFHDIGKIKKPLYFVENQRDGENRHDKLGSSMSALIIRSHVKDGIELAEEHRLPSAIIEMIPQHHGTSRIEYFYDKACKEAEEAGDDPTLVDATLYCYPGPKPQTKEAGILMLADGIEAATRTIHDPSFDRIQGLVQKMINKVFSSGELDECELTLKDLHAIAKAFTRTLSGIYHQRIAYAEPAEKGNSADESVPIADAHKGEDLKRLGVE